MSSTFGETTKNIYSTLLTECHLEGLKQELYLRERIVIFVQRTELWNRIKQYCLEFHERFVESGCNPDLLLGPLIVTLNIDYGALKKFDTGLLDDFVREPIYYEKAFREVILSIANSFFEQLERSFRIRLEQIHCRLRTKLPLEEPYLFRTQPNNVSIGLTAFRCVVQGYSSIQKYILQSVWLCAADPLRIAIAGEIKRAPKCEDCGNLLQEHQRIRAVSDFCTVRVFVTDSLRTRTTVGRIYQSVLVRLADDLCEPLKLGYEYVITGVFNPLNQFFDAWAFEEL
ncbi:AAEL009488-PA [Aedes aegypti]|uniref:AAEL009488-PA n=1 Tax=Aedes aegypti TaxID=7159 RepID=Q16VP8_AEDAE|nr:AAEL009488-PA [Aedes aegypti]